MENQIPGVPDGWELVRIGTPVFNVDWVVNFDGNARLCDYDSTYLNRPVIRKIEKPARYRPFANAEEFKPHRDRWWRLKDVPVELIGPRGIFTEPPEAYAEGGFAGCTWQGAFELRCFEDGSPFGVKINE